MINISKNIGKGQVNLLCYQEDKNNLDGSLMKIQEIEITNIGGIPYLKLENLDPRMNIICGENGVGKTNILDTIANAFSFFQNDALTIRQGSQDGAVAFKIDEQHYSNPVKLASATNDISIKRSGLDLKLNSDMQRRLLYLKTNRVFSYRRLNSIENDLDSSPSTQNHFGIHNEKLKNWLAHRSLHAGNINSGIDSLRLYNFDIAKKAISLLNSSFSYKNTTLNNEIIVSTPSGDIFLEMLSSGFKSSLFVILGIIQEIEYRFKEDIIKVDDFDGVILIDEIELHLHPEWQGKIISILKEIFPIAQFFITTHSPHVIQSAGYSEIIALDKKDLASQGNSFTIYRRELPDSPEYGFQGWTIEEVLTDVMGMQSTRGDAYKEQIAKFDLALEEQDREKAEKAYKELEKMIHPNSHARKMLQLEMVGLE